MYRTEYKFSPVTDRTHRAYEMDRFQRNPNGDIRDKVLKIRIPLMRSALATGNKTDLPSSKFWFVAEEESGCSTTSVSGCAPNPNFGGAPKSTVSENELPDA